MSNKYVQGLIRDDCGTVAMIFALLVTALFSVLALAVDMARAYRSDNKITIALDAAALAAARGLGEGQSNTDVTQIANKVFNATIAANNDAMTYSGLKVDIDRWNDVVSVSINAAMKTAFAGVFGRDQISLNRATTVTYKVRRLELAMSLDVTGSMLWPISPSDSTIRLDALKSAAKDVLDTLFTSAAADDRVRVSIVPWSTAVNVGSIAGTVSQNQSVDNCVVERLGHASASDALPYGSDAMRAFTSPPAGYSCPPSPIVPLLDRSRATDLDQAIDNLQAVGGTAGHLGTAWGWYTLAPSWSGIWPTESRPRAYKPSEVIKAVLIMSDGEFNISWKTTTDRANNQTLMRDESYAQFQALCTQMKNKGMVIYTVGFGLTDPTAIDQMQTCASSATNFLQASNATELKAAFQQVAVDLKAMRVTR